MRKYLKNEKIRFLIAGSFNTTLDFTILNVLVKVGFPTLVANTFSVSIGITVSYFLNHFFVFQSKEKISLKKFISFFCVTGFGSLIIQNVVISSVEAITHSNWGRSLILFQQLDGHQTLELNVAKALAVGVGMVWNFILYKYVIFKNKSGESFLEMEEELETKD